VLRRLAPPGPLGAAGGLPPPPGGVPFWVIPELVGVGWGDQGYGYLAIQDSPGVCGMQLGPRSTPSSQVGAPMHKGLACGASLL